MKKTVLFLLLPLVLLSPGERAAAQSNTAAPPAQQEQSADPQAEMEQAKQKVTAIVNQPITHLPRTEWSAPTMFSPGWFHPGAIKPDFNTVDIRKTQEFPYKDAEHVSSDLNPTEMFIGSELEFNPMTKYFYLDRKIPKKRLSEAEMLEINRLYRIIGRDEQLLAESKGLGGMVTSSGKSLGALFAGEYGMIAQLLLLSLVGFFLYRKLYR